MSDNYLGSFVNQYFAQLHPQAFIQLIFKCVTKPHLLCNTTASDDVREHFGFTNSIHYFLKDLILKTLLRAYYDQFNMIYNTLKSSTVDTQ